MHPCFTKLVDKWGEKDKDPLINCIFIISISISISIKTDHNFKARWYNYPASW